MRKGFTLIELLVVITILAILAGAALPYVQNYVEESRVAKAKTDLEEIARALAVYETREGDYPDTGDNDTDGESDVSQLTGRYLNKAPIDPWGSQYVINIDSGTVYSKGPDRLDTGDGKFDNIIAPYQPPLALVSAKWIDKNQSGAVDTQNVNDELQLNFSRKLITPLSQTSMTSFTEYIYLSLTTQLSTFAATPTLVGERSVIYKISTRDAFITGQDALSVTPNHKLIKDRASPNNDCISDQRVVILPQ